MGSFSPQTFDVAVIDLLTKSVKQNELTLKEKNTIVKYLSVKVKLTGVSPREYSIDYCMLREVGGNKVFILINVFLLTK